MSDDSAMVSELPRDLLAVRGVLAAAVVGVDGEFLSGEAADKTLLERMVGTVTSALAAGEALAGLLEGPGEADSGATVADGASAGDPTDGSLDAHPELGTPVASVDDPEDGADSPGPDDQLAAVADGLHAGDTERDTAPAAALSSAGLQQANGAAGKQRQLMVMYQDGGPILFTPLPGGTRIAVVALSSSHDIGRARFQLRTLTNARFG